MVPGYITNAAQSQWHSSALLFSAIETLTIPSRSRAGSQKLGRLADMESVLNVNGNQRMANLGLTVRFESTKEDSKDEKDTQDQVVKEDQAADGHDEAFDIDFAPKSEALSVRRKNHIFGQVVVARGVAEDREYGSLEVDERRRRRYMSEAIVER